MTFLIVIASIFIIFFIFYVIFNKDEELRKTFLNESMDEDAEQLISDLTTLKIIIGLSNYERGIIDRAINYIEKRRDVNDDI